MTTNVTITETPVEVIVQETAITANITETSTTVTVAASITDHGALSGLGDNDHSQYLLKSGGTMTGDIVLPGDPDAALEAATKQYVDAQAGGASDVDDLTTNTGNATEMLRVDGAGTGLEYRTPAQVLADIGAVDKMGDTMTGALSISVPSGIPLTVQGPSGGYAFEQNRHDGPVLFRISNQGAIDGAVRGYVNVNDNLRTAADKYVFFGGGGVCLFGGGNKGAISHGMFTTDLATWTRSINGNYLGVRRLTSSTSSFIEEIRYTTTATGTILETGAIWGYEPGSWAGFRLKIKPGLITANPINAMIEATDVDAVTAAITNIGILGHNSSGTPATGFGAGLLYQLESSTTEDSDAARIAALWNVATHASREADLVLSAYEQATEREFLRGRGSGGGAQIGFLGATPSSQQTGGAQTAGGTYGATEQDMLQKAYDALRTFGLLS